MTKATWEVLAKSRYTDNLNKWRKHGRPVHVTESIWARWNEAWGTAEFRARSERMSLNRRTEKARLGTGLSRHWGFHFILRACYEDCKYLELLL